MFERRRCPSDTPQAHKKFGAGGIKAVVALNTLGTLIGAAKMHCAICKLQLDAAGAAPHAKCKRCPERNAVETAEAILKKYRTRKANCTALGDRARAEEAERERGADGGERLYGEEAATPEFKPLNTALADGLDRPTRW